METLKEIRAKLHDEHIFHHWRTIDGDVWCIDCDLELYSGGPAPKSMLSKYEALCSEAYRLELERDKQ